MGEWYDKHRAEIEPASHWYPATARFGAEGVTATARPVAKAADQNALAVARRAGPTLTEPERQYVLAVARGEGYYGLGWKAGQGAGSHNWGAVQGTGPAGSFQHLDHHADGTPYTTAFKAYNSDDEGFRDMARILLKSNVKKALNTKRSLRQAVMAQHSNGYFELDPEKYLSAVLKNYNALASSLPIPRILSEKGTTVLGQVTIAAIVLGGGYGGYKWWEKRKARRHV